VAARILSDKNPTEWYVLMEIVAFIFIVNIVLIVAVYSPYPNKKKLIIDKKALLNHIK
jgi:hypothetical protein